MDKLSKDGDEEDKLFWQSDEYPASSNLWQRHIRDAKGPQELLLSVSQVQQVSGMHFSLTFMRVWLV